MKLKIAIIAPQWLKTKGGPTTYVKNLAEKLNKKGQQVFILTCEKSPDIFCFYKNNKVKRQIELIKLLIKLKPDIIHIHGRLPYIVPCKIYKEVLNRKVKIVFTFHTQPHYKDFLDNSKKVNARYSILKSALENIVLNLCDQITSVSNSLILNLKKYNKLSISNYAVIQSGGEVCPVNPDEVAAFQKEYLSELSTPVLSTIGVFSWDWKVAGHKIAIEAVALLKVKYPQIKLLIAGDGSYRDYLVDLSERLGVRKNIVFCGNMDNPNIILKVSDVYVHMALNEGSPLSVIEAMLNKKPIVASNRGGISEIIINNYTGLLIEPTPENLSNSIIALLQDKDTANRLANNAFSYANDNLDWNIITEQYLNLYFDLFETITLKGLK